MTGDTRTPWSERWFRLLLRFYPTDFREEMGDALVDAYRQRAHVVLSRGGGFRLAGIWMTALIDSLRNGLGEDVRSVGSGDEVEVTRVRRVQRGFECLLAGGPDRARWQPRVSVGVVGVVRDRIDRCIEQTLTVPTESVKYCRVRI